MRTLILLLTVSSVCIFNSPAGELPVEVVEKISSTIRKHCPEAEIQIVEEVLVARYGTMMFTLHGRSKTGEIHPRTYEAEGPNFEGFILRVSLKEGQYQGARRFLRNWMKPISKLLSMP